MVEPFRFERECLLPLLKILSDPPEHLLQTVLLFLFLIELLLQVLLIRGSQAVIITGNHPDHYYKNNKQVKYLFHANLILY